MPNAVIHGAGRDGRAEVWSHYLCAKISVLKLYADFISSFCAPF